MKGRIQPKTLVAVGLIAVCAFLVVRLILQTARAGAGAPAPRRVTSAPPAASSSAQRPSGVAAYDPTIRLDLLKSASGRELPQLLRDPFEFEPTPAQVQAKNAAAAAASRPPAPPPPPPIPLQALGYDQDEGGKLAAYLADDQDTYIVHEGEEFDKRFRVLKITPTMVEIEDETYHQTAQLPFPE